MAIEKGDVFPEYEQDTPAKSTDNITLATYRISLILAGIIGALSMLLVVVIYFAFFVP